MKRIIFLMAFITSQAIAQVFTPQEAELLKNHFFANFHANGAIVASPSKQNPNYYYDWVRDSAIAMGLVETWYESSLSDDYKNRLQRYVSWTASLQQQQDPLPGMDILGEPKFYIDGKPFDGVWGRPQNDGPALRASTLTRFAQQLLNQGEGEYVKTHLYQPTMNPATMGVIKRDLEYTAHHWQDADYDLWEEVLGHHFFTAMVQQKALIEGAALARTFQDNKAADYYESQAQQIHYRLLKHIDIQNHLIQATIAPHPGPQKTLELDTAVVLGVLLNPKESGSFSIEDTIVENTVKNLRDQYATLYPINQNAQGPVLFGRYPGDTYDGYRNDGQGNPWFILTATMAEYYYTLAHRLPKNDENTALFNQYVQTGDGYLRLIKKYAPELSMDEQINLNTGMQQGAATLTWSYTSVLRAIELRNKLEN